MLADMRWTSLPSPPSRSECFTAYSSLATIDDDSALWYPRPPHEIGCSAFPSQASLLRNDSADILGLCRPFGARREIPNGTAYRWNLVKPSDSARGTGASEKPHDVGGPDVDKGSHPDRFVRCSACVRCLLMVFRSSDAHCSRGSLLNAKST